MWRATRRSSGCDVNLPAMSSVKLQSFDLELKITESFALVSASNRRRTVENHLVGKSAESRSTSILLGSALTHQNCNSF
jgi:hypothetical protein